MQGRKRGCYLVRVVGEIVDDRDTGRRAHNLESPTDALETGQSRGGVDERHTAGARRGQGRERIGDVVQPRNLEVHLDGLSRLSDP